MMRVLLVASALALPAGLASAQSEEFPLYAAFVESGDGTPIPAVNVVLVQDGVELAADTTDATGFAEFPAREAGEYSISLQDPAPVNGLLLAVSARQEWSAEVVAGAEGPALLFRAEAGEMVQLWFVTLDENYVPAEPGEAADPAPPPLEHTHADADADAQQ